MAYKPSIAVLSDSGDGISKIVIAYQTKFFIDSVITEASAALAEAARRAVLEDKEFRTIISEAIELAVKTLPMEILIKEVKKAVREAAETSAKEGDKKRE